MEVSYGVVRELISMDIYAAHQYFSDILKNVAAWGFVLLQRVEGYCVLTAGAGFLGFEAQTSMCNNCFVHEPNPSLTAPIKFNFCRLEFLITNTSQDLLVELVEIQNTNDKNTCVFVPYISL